MPMNFIPVFVRVSNFEDDNDVRNYDKLQEFKVSAKSLVGVEEFKLIATGYRVPDEVKNFANRRIRRALQAENPAAACEEVLVAAIREVAKETNVVGQNLLSSCIPHPMSINSWDVILSSRPNASLKTFRYLPANDSDSREVGPVVLTADGTIMSEFCKQTFPSGEESIKVRIDFNLTAR